LNEHIFYALSYPNASLQSDHDEDDFRRSIAEALVCNHVLATKEESEEESSPQQESSDEEDWDEEGEERGGEDLFVFKSQKIAETKTSPRAPVSARRPSVRQVSESVLDLNFSFENQDPEELEGGSEEAASFEGSSAGDRDRDRDRDLSSAQALKVQSSELVVVGRQLKQLEQESKRTQEKALKDWQKAAAPKLKEEIRGLDKKIEALKKEQKAASKNKTGFQSHFDEAIRALSAEQDALKLQLFFPSDPPVTFGIGGVYFAMDYVWLESLAGKFRLKLSSTSFGSQIVFQLQGAGDSAGVGADITIDGFKLKSENKAIPSLALDTLNIRVSFRVELLLSFFVAKQRWTATPDQFVVQLLSFKGPFGISRSMVSALLSVVVPAIKRAVLDMLPPELGVLLSDVMVPLDVEGAFQVDGGVVVQELFHGMQKSAKICQKIGYNSEQMLNFLGLQKSLDRKSNIKSVVDLLRYRNVHCKQPQWEGIIRLWDQAALLYYQARLQNPATMMRESEIRMTEELSFENEDDEDVEFASSAFLSFEKLLRGAVEVEKNPLSVRFSLDTFRLDVTLCLLLRHCGEYYSRIGEELLVREADGGVATRAEKLFTDKMQTLCREGQQRIALRKQLVHNLQFLLRMHVTSGPEGEVCLVAKDVYTQFPISFNVNMAADEDSVFSPIVPTMKNVRTKEDGFVSIKLFHLGSEEMLKKAKFLAYKNKSKLDVMLNSPTSLRLGGVQSDLSESSQQPPDARAAQRKAFESFLVQCEKGNLEARQLLSVRPHSMSSVKIATFNVLRPRMSFIVNDLVTLQPGTALFIVQVGADRRKQASASAKEQGQEKGQREREERVSRRRKSTMLGGDECVQEASSSFELEEEEEEEEEEKGTLISAQGTNGLRTEAHIPEMQFQGKIPQLMQFMAHHFDDVELLSDFYDEPVEESEKRAQVMQLVLGIVGKYMLTPNFELLVNLGALVASHPEDVSVILSNNKKYTPALNLFMKVDVLDLLADWTALMNAMVES
jgi:hypothetical protein